MKMRAASLTIALLLAGCGRSAPQADMPARTWKYYEAHPVEIEPMQRICREWSASNAPAVTEPAVVAANCRAAAFARSQLQLTK
jgi:hypothetical protein